MSLWVSFAKFAQIYMLLIWVRTWERLYTYKQAIDLKPRLDLHIIIYTVDQCMHKLLSMSHPKASSYVVCWSIFETTFSAEQLQEQAEGVVLFFLVYLQGGDWFLNCSFSFEDLPTPRVSLPANLKPASRDFQSAFLRRCRCLICFMRSS